MALITRGSTLCAVCGQVLAEGDEIVGLPAFASGPADPHWRFSDAGFHAWCFERLPERGQIEMRVAEQRRRHDQLRETTDRALLQAWRQATADGTDLVPQEFAALAASFDMAGYVKRDGERWRFTRFGIARAESLEA